MQKMTSPSKHKPKGAKQAKTKLLENQVEDAVIRWMEARHWRAVRQPTGRYRTESGARVTVGVPGDPDWRFERPIYLATIDKVVIEQCFFEAKAPGEKPEAKQIERMAQLRADHRAVAWADSVDMWAAWYGMQRFSDLIAIPIAKPEAA